MILWVGLGLSRGRHKIAHPHQLLHESDRKKATLDSPLEGTDVAPKDFLPRNSRLIAGRRPAALPRPRT